MLTPPGLQPVVHQLMRQVGGWQQSVWLAWVAWLGTAVLAVAGTSLTIGRLAESHLGADAERSALGWARHIASHVPAIDQVFEGALPSAQAQDRLATMLGTAGLFRFKLFAPDGRLLLVSDALDRAASGSGSGAGNNSDSARAARAASGHHNHVALNRGDGARRPLHYSEAYVPVRQGGRTLGVVEVYIDQTQLAALTASSFRRAAVTAGLALALAFGGVTLLWRWRAGRDRRTQERVRYLAHHDVLTGAINHTSFNESLTHACAVLGHQSGRADNQRDDQLDNRRDKQRDDSARPGLAVLCIDLDRFGEINEAHGHGAGDELLRLVAARLHGALRGADLLARLAGDRFAVLQADADGSAAVQALAQRIVESLEHPYRLSGGAGSVVVTASVGAAVFGVDGRNAHNLLQRAELALLQAKAQGSARWCFYDAQLDEALHERRMLAAELRSALAQGGLRLHFQPLFGAAGEGLVGYEALARWPHATRGMVPPLRFVSVAEETGQIGALGRWVLHSACHEAASWPAPLSVAVNLSPAQFRRGGADLVDEVRAALAASGLAPQRLELEITESLLMNHTDQVLATLHALHALGVRIAMDDFGTGYSSLAYLWRFPFDKLKIDRAFTQGLGSDGKVDVIVNSIVTLAHSLAIRVNAEGVETDAQRQALRAHGCDELQGFLLGRPQPPEQLVHRVRLRAGAA